MKSIDSFHLVIVCLLSNFESWCYMIIVVVGPTAVGKTKMSIELAKQFNGEVINADSTQIYKGLDIATAKVTEEEMDGVVHHLLDVRDITSDYTVYDYQKDARNCIDDILGRGKTPILVGGTGLYIKAALYNYEFGDSSNHEQYLEYSDQELFEKLLLVDPNTKVHPNNRKRVVRSLNYYYDTGKPFSEQELSDQLMYDDVYFIGLTTDRDYLYERINLRVDKMMEQGLLLEAKQVYDTEIRTKAVMTPIGYKELFPYFDGVEQLEVCVEKIKQNSRKYAKRQYTWFRHQLPVIWFDVCFEDFQKTVDEVVSYIC